MHSVHQGHFPVRKSVRPFLIFRRIMIACCHINWHSNKTLGTQAEVMNSCHCRQSTLQLCVVSHTSYGLQVVSLQGIRSMQAAFEAFLDILKCQMDNCKLLGLPERHAEEAASYIESVALQLLALGDARSRAPGSTTALAADCKYLFENVSLPA